MWTDVSDAACSVEGHTGAVCNKGPHGAARYVTTEVGGGHVRCFGPGAVAGTGVGVGGGGAVKRAMCLVTYPGVYIDWPRLGVAVLPCRSAEVDTAAAVDRQVFTARRSTNHLPVPSDVSPYHDVTYEVPVRDVT